MGQSRLKLLIDECLSPQLAASMTRFIRATWARLGEPDHVVLARCLAEDRVIVTENAVDFRKLVARQEIHPGLIVLPSVARERSLALLLAAIAHLKTLGTPGDVIVNHVLEVGVAGQLAMFPPP
ncbi:DUF5615 family PIN-like protein [Sphingobium sp. DEHP117]|uniref:DUF5615 family PIN-like protein n=1 Tax=Sphingobium sp. DEHP117 TaxID=2993436 RepID=UPI0027D6DFD8|nr:DUF5615 family PIN-like protein [Sphingobium sp. DEHP117]MDQ4422122.1 DUF5615 family PIN-like protein [Sphingobium sp. DEHP117]